MNRTVYLDNNATTPLLPEVKKHIQEIFDIYGNASSMHTFGRAAGHLIKNARKNVASLINADPSEIIFTGGGSESNNTVLKMIAFPGKQSYGFPKGRKEIITSVIEHPCVLETVKYLSDYGIDVKFLKVDKFGIINPDSLSELISEKTALVSIMMANNEIGTIQNIKKMSEIAHSRGALFHTDAVQAVGKIPVDVADLDIDYLTLSSHKIYGPKGVAALYVKKGSPLSPLIHGGHQESGWRAGTINTMGISGFGKTAEIIKNDITEYSIKYKALRNRLKEGIEKTIPDVSFNGHPDKVLPNTLNVSFAGAEGEASLLYLDMQGIAISTGSACATRTLEPSYVLMATGLGAEMAHGSIRFSLGRETTEDDIDYVLEKLEGIIKNIRSISTLYSGGKK